MLTVSRGIQFRVFLACILVRHHHVKSRHATIFEMSSRNVKESLQRLQVTRRRTLLPLGWRVEAQSAHPLEPGMLSLLADRLLRQLWRAIGTAPTIRDVRGTSRVPAELRAQVSAEGVEPFALIQGELTAEGEPPRPFSFSLCTRFLRRDGPHHIEHTLESSATGAIPLGFPRTLFGRALPIALRRVYIGCELYRSECLIPYLGFSPTIVASLTLDCTERGLECTLSSSRLKSPHAIRMSDFPMAVVILSSLQEVLHLPLETMIDAKLHD